jgi:hypothetical protein
MTPPSSGGGSGSIHRVSFHEEIAIIKARPDYEEVNAYTGVESSGHAAYYAGSMNRNRGSRRGWICVLG